MATPYVSGSLALLKSQFPNTSVQKLREILQSTATNIPYAYEKSLRTSVAQQGGGLINVYNAIHFESSVSPSELNLGDLDQLKPQEITIENNSGTSKTYGDTVISHEPAGETNLVPHQYRNDRDSALPGLYASYATIKFSSTSITLKAGESANFTATFQPPSDIADDFLPVYSGFIKITNNNDQFKVAYLGQPYSRYKTDYIDATSNTGTKLPELVVFDENNAQNTVTDIQTYDFGLSAPGEGYPYLNWLTLQSSQYFRIDIVPYNTTFVPDFYGFTFNETNLKYTDSETSYGVPDSALPLQYPNLPFSDIGTGADTRPTWYLWALVGVAYDYGAVPLGDLPAGD
ncbi:hypothetical protein BKA61DRAFT_571547 [Leptodontidium sp. MPI-SDFR-AT-0119]|nr:hypothetical protein BKA61DRAFT_571547 [Leptodontidium sp. MPI-SDFR-AT-0119]